MNPVGAVAEHEVRQILRSLMYNSYAITCQQFPSHEDEGCLHVLGLLGRCFQSSQHTIVFCQSARILEQHLPLRLEVGLVTCSDEQSSGVLQNRISVELKGQITQKCNKTRANTHHYSLSADLMMNNYYFRVHSSYQ